MAVPLLDLHFQNAPLLAEMRTAFEQIIDSSRFVLGERVQQFEQQLAQQCGTACAVGVSSGTDALLVALMALGIGPGDEVVTPAFTFFATAGCVQRVGATPVFVDIDPVTFNMDPDLIEPALTPRTRAVIPVHLYGQAASMGPIMRVARRHGLAVIEDAAQAIAARDGDQRVGSIGDVGCLSFYPTKNLSALGDAGACVTNDAELAQRLACLRVHGQDTKYHHNCIGGNFRIDALQAAMLQIKLTHLASWTDARRAAARCYDQLLTGLPLVCPKEADGRYHVYNQYTVRVTGGCRDRLCRHLARQGIGHEVYYPVPLHLQPCFSHLGTKRGALPVTEQAAGEVLSLPIYPGLTRSQQEEVASEIRRFLAQEGQG